jgi:hypothetical protein
MDNIIHAEHRFKRKPKLNWELDDEAIKAILKKPPEFELSDKALDRLARDVLKQKPLSPVDLWAMSIVNSNPKEE